MKDAHCIIIVLIVFKLWKTYSVNDLSLYSSVNDLSLYENKVRHLIINKMNFDEHKNLENTVTMNQINWIKYRI